MTVISLDERRRNLRRKKSKQGFAKQFEEGTRVRRTMGEHQFLTLVTIVTGAALLFALAESLLKSGLFRNQFEGGNR